MLLFAEEVHWSNVGVFWATVLATLVAGAATYVTYLVYRSETDPHVIVYVKPDKRRPSIVLLIIENIGKGLAREISFEFSRPMPGRAFGFEDAPTPQPMDEGPLIHGVPALGPGASMIVTWGQYGGIYKGIGDAVIYVTVRFKGDGLVFKSKSFEVICPIDIKSWEATDASDDNWEKEAAEQLEKIAKALAKIAQKQ